MYGFNGLLDQHVQVPSPVLPQLHHPPLPQARLHIHGLSGWQTGMGLADDIPGPSEKDSPGWNMCCSSDGLIMDVSSHLLHSGPQKFGAHSEQVMSLPVTSYPTCSVGYRFTYGESIHDVYSFVSQSHLPVPELEPLPSHLPWPEQVRSPNPPGHC